MVSIFLGFGLLANAMGCVLLFFAKNKHDKAQRLLYEARLETDSIKRDLAAERRESSMQLAEELNKKRHLFQEEVRKGKLEVDREYTKLSSRKEHLNDKERFLDKRIRELEKREGELDSFKKELKKRAEALEEQEESFIQKLEEVSLLTQEEAKSELLSVMQSQANNDHERWLQKVEEEARSSAKEKGRSLVIDAMQRYAAEHVSLNAASVVHLPNDDMKGRIIGREGRNIKALELTTGMEFVIGDTPEVITISGFNPIRREVARRTLERLVADGRINPTRIEETVLQTEAEIEEIIKEKGKAAILELNLHNVHKDIIVLLGKLHFRTSYSQNVLSHSIEVAHMARMLAEELGLPRPDLAARAGLFHDMGKSASEEYEGPHAQVGADIARRCGEDPILVNAIAAHHEEVPFKTLYDPLIVIADTISASRPGARRETLAAYIKRLEQLEGIAGGFTGVKKAYALQAGREIRILVEEDKMNDEASIKLARQVADAVEAHMNFPGQIKINVIREKRSIEYAK